MGDDYATIHEEIYNAMKIKYENNKTNNIRNFT
jgi:hypothetical protein